MMLGTLCAVWWVLEVRAINENVMLGFYLVCLSHNSEFT